MLPLHGKPNLKGRGLLAGFLAALAGCQTTGTLPTTALNSAAPIPSAIVQAAASDCPPGGASVVVGPLTLDQAIHLALQRHPRLQEADALVSEAHGKWVQAGFYPNPTVGYSGEQIGSDGTAGQQSGFVAQEIVTGGKLRLDQAMAAQVLTAAQWQVVTQRFELEAQVRAAFYEVLAAQRSEKETLAILKIAEDNLAVSEKLDQAGRGARPNVLRAQVELETNRNQLEAARQRTAAAWALFANTLGVPDLPPTELAGDLEGSKPNFSLAEVQNRVLSTHSELQVVQAELARAETSVRRARVENLPNLELQLQPLYDYTEDRVQATVIAGARLPVWNQNQGNIQAAQAEVLRRTAELANVRLQLNQRIVTAFQQYATARAQAERFEKDLLPRAREAQRLSQVAFESGDARFDYTSLLDAQRTYANARLSYVQTLADLWKAAAELQGLLQEP